MVELLFSYGFPMVFPWFSHGFPVRQNCKRVPVVLPSSLGSYPTCGRKGPSEVGEFLQGELRQPGQWNMDGTWKDHGIQSMCVYIYIYIYIYICGIIEWDNMGYVFCICIYLAKHRMEYMDKPSCQQVLTKLYDPLSMVFT